MYTKCEIEKSLEHYELRHFNFQGNPTTHGGDDGDDMCMEINKRDFRSCAVMYSIMCEVRLD